MLTTVEKVILLQNVDLFAEVDSEHLALLAVIAEEVSYLAGDLIYREDDAADAMYLVLSGSVVLTQAGREIATVEKVEAIGTWALFDAEVRVVTATARENCRLLRIDREDFADLLADQVQVAQGILRAVTRRLRTLASRAT